MRGGAHFRFWALALLWLPAGIVATAAIRFWGAPGPGLQPAAVLAALESLAPAVPCGLPLALGCRRLWRLGHVLTAWAAGTVLGAATVTASLFAGLLGPLAVAAAAIVFSLPVWIAALRLRRRGRHGRR